jgi:hypothetical protein
VSLPSKTPKPSDSIAALIKDWLWNFGAEHKEDVAPKLDLWLDAFGGMDAETLESLFRRALTTCKFFPKVSEILEPIRRVEETATPQAAIEAWERVLGLRRQYWNPDAPGGFWPGMPKLSERVQAACRASGVFHDFETIDGLHIWAKKVFVESFVAWGETEQNKFLLPEGEIKKLLTSVAEAKALPSSSNWQDLHGKGHSYCARPSPAASSPEPKRRFITPQPSSRSIEEQKEILRRKGFLK